MWTHAGKADQCPCARIQGCHFKCARKQKSAGISPFASKKRKTVRSREQVTQSLSKTTGSSETSSKTTGPSETSPTAPTALGDAQASLPDSVHQTVSMEICYFCGESPMTMFTNCGHMLSCQKCYKRSGKRSIELCFVCRRKIVLIVDISEKLVNSQLPKCLSCANHANVILRPCNCLAFCKECLNTKEFLRFCPFHGNEFGRIEIFGSS